MFMSNWWGIYEWRGDRWQLRKAGGFYNTGPIIPVYKPSDPFDQVTFYIHNRSGVQRIENANIYSYGRPNGAAG
jgi:hypothetical protein